MRADARCPALLAYPAGQVTVEMVRGVHTAQQHNTAMGELQATSIQELCAKMVGIEQMSLGKQVAELTSKVYRTDASVQSSKQEVEKMRALTNDLDERFKRLMVMNEQARSAAQSAA